MSTPSCVGRSASASRCRRPSRRPSSFRSRKSEPHARDASAHDLARRRSWLRALLDPARWFGGVAHAAPLPTEGVSGLTREQLARLNRWVPKRSELPEYLPLVRTLLRTTSAETASAKSLPSSYRKLYADLQLATAWQETCWRQYVRLGGTIRPLRSSAGAVGLMQVNVRAWRGFYDPQRSDGRHRLQRTRRQRDPAALPGRPGAREVRAQAARRRRQPGARDLRRVQRRAESPVALPPRRTRARACVAIDASLFRKYKAVRDGRELEVARCYG